MLGTNGVARPASESMKLGYWILLAGLAYLSIKYYHFIGPRFLILLAGVYAFRLLVRWLGAKILQDRNTKTKEDVHDKAIDAEFEIIEEEKQ